MDVGYNPVNRLMQQDHFSRMYHSGSPGGPPRGDPIRNFRADATVGIIDAQPYGNADREHFLPGNNSGMLVDRNEGSVDEGQRYINGSSHVTSVVNTGSRVLDWSGTAQPGEMGHDEYRDMDERDGSTGGSQSDGSEEDEEDDGDIGEGEEIESHQGVTRLVDRGLPGQRGYEPIPNIQMDGIDGNRDEVISGIQNSEGFQKKLSSRASTSSAPSLGMFLSQTPTIPFLNSFSSPPSVGPMLGHGDSGSMAPNGTIVASGLATSAGYYRDCIGKETNVRDPFGKENQNYGHEQGRVSHSSPVPDSAPVASASEHYGALVPASSVVPLHDAENPIGELSQRKSHDTLEMPLRSALMDPLTGTLMDDATILSCGHSFGSESLQRVIENNACISCGSAAKREDMAPNHALQSVVQAYRREERKWKESASKAAKRRRERQDQERQSSGDLTPLELSRQKGVQFPYKVDDKVLIKGNKRTPERFMGRAAVITTQCLNGWYVVRTLDNGESVKLQYRSLAKADEQLSTNENEVKNTGPHWL